MKPLRLIIDGYKLHMSPVNDDTRQYMQKNDCQRKTYVDLNDLEKFCTSHDKSSVLIEELLDYLKQFRERPSWDD